MTSKSDQASRDFARAHRKALGAYYTPPEVVDPLVRWAVSTTSRRILDPSFGDGRFLAAAAKWLDGLGVPSPSKRLFGVELDPCNAKEPPALQSISIPKGRLIKGDFFATDLDTWDGKRFNAIVGNPPYVRHHRLEPTSRALAQRHAARVGVDLSERSDLWAYFCAALLDYLEPKGRLAVLLPGAILHADYALPLLHALSEARGHVRLIRVQNRLFHEVAERTIVLLIDGLREEPGVDYREVQDATELANLLGSPPVPASNGREGTSLSLEANVTPAGRLRTKVGWFLDHEIAGLWDRLVGLPEICLLGDVAELRIGVVTGANQFFVLNGDEAQRLACDGVQTVPIVSRGGWLQTTRWTAEAQAAKSTRPSQLLLIDRQASLTGPLHAAVERAELEELHKRGHCSKRDPWYCLNDHAAPDLFLPYMGASPPHLVLNIAGATCTNTVHRVSLRPGQASAATLAAASWTSLYRLSAELAGRSYGGGVLKLELGEAALLRIPVLPGSAHHLKAIEEALLNDGAHAANQCADKLILREGLGISSGEIRSLRDAALRLQQRRKH